MIRGWLVASLLFFAGCEHAQAPALRASSANSPVTATPASPPGQPPPLALESFQTTWEIIRDSHFDTNFSGLDWSAVRTNLLPKVERARTQEEVRDVIQEMLDKLGHSHLMIIPGTPPRTTNSIAAPAAPKTSPPAEKKDRPQNGGIGVEVRVLNGQIVVFRVEPESPAAKAGLTPGWIIKEIGGEPAVDPTVPEGARSRRQIEFLLWHNAAHLLRGPVGENCALTVDRGDGRLEKITISRVGETGFPAKLGNLPTMFTRVRTNEIRTVSGKRVGYLWFNLWMLPAAAAINSFVDEYRNAGGIIVDMRGNLGGIGGMVMGAAGHFVNERGSLGQMKMRDNELNFVTTPRRVDTKSQPTNTFQGKLAILTDPITLSSAELFAGGMQELGRARLFGEPTGGQALPSVSDRLPNGDLLYHAVADFVTPKGRRLEGNGVIPDEIIPLRLEALRAGKDEVLDAALQWMNRD